MEVPECHTGHLKSLARRGLDPFTIDICYTRLEQGGIIERGDVVRRHGGVGVSEREGGEG
jgi:hypothetical protein